MSYRVNLFGLQVIGVHQLMTDGRTCHIVISQFNITEEIDFKIRFIKFILKFTFKVNMYLVYHTWNIIINEKSLSFFVYDFTYTKVDSLFVWAYIRVVFIL